MKLGTKIVAISAGSIFFTAAAGLLIQRSVIRREGIQGTYSTMRAMVLGAENTRESISALRAAGVYDDAKLQAELKTTSDFRQATIYSTVPVVAAWKSIGHVAEEEGYTFRVPAHNPRNPKNLPTGDEENILRKLKSEKLPEYFQIDENVE